MSKKGGCIGGDGIWNSDCTVTNNGECFKYENGIHTVIFVIVNCAACNWLCRCLQQVFWDNLSNNKWVWEVKCKIYIGLTPENTARQTLLPTHKSMLSSMFSSSALDVVAFEVAHTVGKRACMESAICLLSTLTGIGIVLTSIGLQRI